MKKEYIVEITEEEADELMDEHWVGELVRCKDCTFRNEINCPQYYRRSELPDDWYCADGERRETE